jgi:hypothetical protein
MSETDTPNNIAIFAVGPRTETRRLCRFQRHDPRRYLSNHSTRLRTRVIRATRDDSANSETKEVANPPYNLGLCLGRPPVPRLGMSHTSSTTVSPETRTHLTIIRSFVMFSSCFKTSTESVRGTCLTVEHPSWRQMYQEYDQARNDDKYADNG